MDNLFIAALAAVGLLVPHGAEAQTPFKNLDFELAQVPPEPAGNLSMSDALPNWGAVADSLATYGVSYNFLMLDSPQVGLYDRKSGRKPLIGDYSAMLMADIGEWDDSKAELFQTGFIPEDAKSLTFATTREPLLVANGLTPEDWQLSLFINGKSVPYRELHQTSDYSIWAADVSMLAGSAVDVRFSLDTSWPVWASGSGIAIGLDGIEFSPTVVPEASLINFLLLGLGAAAYIKRSRQAFV